MRPEQSAAQRTQSAWTGKFGRFLLVGLVATGLQYLVLFAGVTWFGAAPARASGLGFVAGAVANYLLNRKFTFESSVQHATGMLRFGVVAAAGLSLNVLFMHLLTGYLDWHYLLAQMLTTGVVMMWNFVANALWTFRKR